MIFFITLMGCTNSYQSEETIHFDVKKNGKIPVCFASNKINLGDSINRIQFMYSKDTLRIPPECDSFDTNPDDGNTCLRLSEWLTYPTYDIYLNEHFMFSDSLLYYYVYNLYSSNKEGIYQIIKKRGKCSKQLDNFIQNSLQDYTLNSTDTTLYLNTQEYIKFGISMDAPTIGFYSISIGQEFTGKK